VSVSCVTIEFVACTPSTDKLLPWIYTVDIPKVDCRPAFVDTLSNRSDPTACFHNLRLWCVGDVRREIKEEAQTFTISKSGFSVLF